MNHRASEHTPDWYLESLASKYQFLADELARQKAKHLWNGTGGIDVLIFAVLAYFAFGNVWGAVLTALATASVWHGRERQKRYFIAQQLLAIEAEWPDVRDNVVIPALRR